MLGACASDSTKPDPRIADAEFYWDLQLNHHAVTLSTASPYDTLRLIATPRNYRGEPLMGLPAPRYISPDLERVAVTAEGLLVAAGPTSQPLRVIATLTVGNVKHEDTVVVHVVALNPPPVLASLSIHPIPSDSAKFAAVANLLGASSDTLRPRLADSNGVALETLIAGGLPVFLRSSDTTIADLSVSSNTPDFRGPRQIHARRPGVVMLSASTTVFGVSKEDTLSYRVGWPVTMSVEVATATEGVAVGTFLYPDITVGTGAAVMWRFPSIYLTAGIDSTLPEVDITFPETDLPNVVALTPASRSLVDAFVLLFFCGVSPSDCMGTGNIVLGPSTKVAMRAFPVPGTYQYHSVRRGTSGQVVVVDER